MNVKYHVLFALPMLFSSCANDFDFFDREKISFYIDGKKWEAESIYKEGRLSSSDTLVITAIDDEEELVLTISHDYKALEFTNTNGEKFNSEFDFPNQLFQMDIEEYKNNCLEGTFDAKIFNSDGNEKVYISDGTFRLDLE